MVLSGARRFVTPRAARSAARFGQGETVNEAEFSDFFRRMFPRLVAHARRTVGPQTAEDLASRALATLWAKKVPSPVDAGEWQQLDSLTFAILRGLVLNESRAERRRTSLLYKVASDEDPLVPGPEPGQGDAPRWFRELPSADQHVLRLLAEGYSAGEIAGIIGSTPAAVTKRISRARQRIRDLTRRGAGEQDG